MDIYFAPKDCTPTLVKQILSANDSEALNGILLSDKTICRLKEIIATLNNSNDKGTMLKTLGDYILEISSHHDYFITFLVLFVKENFIGPVSFDYHLSEQNPNSIITEFDAKGPFYNFLKENFSIDSEEINCEAKCLIFLYLCEKIIQSKIIWDDINLWSARLYSILNKCLSSNVTRTQNIALDCYEQYIVKFQKDNEIQIIDSQLKHFKSDESLDVLAMLYVEYSHCCLSFYKYTKSQECLENAIILSKMHITLTGKLGRLTKYQTFDTAVLSLDIKQENVSIAKPGETPVSVKFDEESILLEKPSIVNEEAKDVVSVSTTAAAVLCGYCNFFLKSKAKDEMLTELLKPYIEKITGKEVSWVLNSYGLIIRSRNEALSLKRRERSALQMQSLADQTKTQTPFIGARINNMFAVDYPPIWELKKELAYMYMNIGAFKSAYDIFQSVQMYEDTVKCMFISGDRTEATKLAKQILDKNPTPNIYCLLGDIQQENSEKIKYFLKSIEFSNGKYAKAMRMVGKAYYNIKEYDKAIEHLEKALNINTLYPECWYILGCIYLIKKNFKQASLSFGKAAQINETDWQSWANLALSFNELGQPVQAMMAYEQSLRHSDNSERVAFNYLVIALTNSDFSRCYRGFSILLKEGCSSIKPEILARLCSLTSKLQKTDPTRIVNIKKY